MSQRDNHRAQREALRAGPDGAKPDGRHVHTDGLIRYLRLQSERRPRHATPADAEADTSTTRESE